jgi:hypothetical protein
MSGNSVIGPYFHSFPIGANEVCVVLQYFLGWSGRVILDQASTFSSSLGTMGCGYTSVEAHAGELVLRITGTL